MGISKLTWNLSLSILNRIKQTENGSVSLVARHLTDVTTTDNDEPALHPHVEDLSSLCTFNLQLHCRNDIIEPVKNYSGMNPPSDTTVYKVYALLNNVNGIA